ncbi:MAG: DNA-3-methyladenine glycosylase, partial [Ginsengibacter sp.]
LIRAVEPIEGIDTMLQRTGKKKPDFTLTRGPGNVGKALGIFKHHSGLSLNEHELFIAQDKISTHPFDIGTSKRIGVEGAGQDGLLPYRFYVRGNRFVSGKNN